MKLAAVTLLVMLYGGLEGVCALHVPSRLPLGHHRRVGAMSCYNKVSVPLRTRTGIAMASTNEPDGGEDKVIFGMQAKYFYAVCVMLFAFAYDFFVTHNGFKDGWVP